MSHLRSLRTRVVVAVTGIVLLAASGCAGGSDPSSSTPVGSGKSSPSASPSHKAKPRKKHYPSGPPMLLDSIVPQSGTTVGVAMPISIIFTDPVKTGARRQIEKHIALRTSVPVTGAWHWFSPQRVDFRPRGYWQPGTRISLTASFDHVGDGYGRYGTHSYTRSFTIGSDVRTHVYVNQHRTVVTSGPTKVLRSMPSDAGSPSFPSWDGTMAVVGKSRTVRMTSCSVHIACNKKDPNFYDLTLPWDVRITDSGTFLHYSGADPYPGHSYGSHGCVHLSWNDAQWYYNLTKMGDPVTVTGSPRGKASGDNGYADYDVPWSQWLGESGLKQFTTTRA